MNPFRHLTFVVLPLIMWPSATRACSETVLTPADPNPSQYAVMHISMFGAVPGNACSDHRAFEKAAEWFSNRGGNGELQFGEGVYLVGVQHPDPTFYRRGYPPLHFSDCRNLKLIGGPTTIIRYENCLMYGAFDPATGGAVLYGCATDCVPDEEIAWLGPCIRLQRCERVTVQELTLDGNMDDLRIGGRTEYDGWQREHTGIILDNSWDINLTRVHCSQFCLDGLYILAGDETVFPHGDDMRISIDRSSFSWNGRNGVSWLGGSGVSMWTSQFESNGTYLIRSSPGAGLDIEYHDFVFDFDSAPIGEGHFTDCLFKYNKGFGVISDVPGGNLLYVPGGFNFISCTFIGAEKGEALFPNAPGMRFTDCSIHGRTTRPFDCQLSGHLADHTHFERCTFDETYFDPEDNKRYSMSWSSPVDGTYHLFVAGLPNGHGGLTLQSCTLHTYCRLMPFIMRGGEANNGFPNYHALMLDCMFKYEGAHDESEFPLPPGEHNAYYAQWNNAEVNVLELTYPDDYWPSTMCADHIQIGQAWSHNSWPTPVPGTCAANVDHNPRVPAEFPFYRVCPEKYLDPAVGSDMCIQCGDGCAVCRTVLPPPAHHPCELEPEKSYAPEPFGQQALRGSSVTQATTADSVVDGLWVVYDLSGRQVTEFSTSQSRSSVFEHLSKGAYQFVLIDRSSERIVSQKCFVVQ